MYLRSIIVTANIRRRMSFCNEKAFYRAYLDNECDYITSLWMVRIMMIWMRDESHVSYSPRLMIPLGTNEYEQVIPRGLRNVPFEFTNIMRGTWLLVRVIKSVIMFSIMTVF